MTVAPIIGKLFTFIATVYIIRSLPVAEYGIFITVFTYVGLFFVLIDAGLNTLVTREIARNSEAANRYFVNVIVVRTIICILTFLLANGVARWLNYPANMLNYILFYSLFLLTHGTFENYLFIFNGFEKLEYTAISSVAFSFLANALFILVIYLGHGIKPLFIIPPAVSFFVGIAMYVIIISKFIDFKWDIDLSFGWGLLKESWPFAALAVFAMVYNRIDIIMLSKMQTTTAVSYYGSAYKIITALFIFSSAYTAAIFPLFSQLSVDNQNKLFFTYKMSFKVMAAVAFPLIAGVSFFGDEIIILFFKSKYLAAAVPLKILIWSVLLIYFTTVLQCLMYSFNWQRKVAGVFLATTVLNVCLNFVLIPRYSYVGAGVATVICEVFNLVVFYYLVSGFMGMLSWVEVFFKPLLATVIMCCFLYFSKQLAASSITIYFIPIAISSMVLYWLIYRWLKPFNDSEIEQLVKIPLLKHLI